MRENIRANHFPLVSFLLRIAIAVPFLYAAISATLQPENWMGYFPVWLQAIIPGTILLVGFSLYQVTLSIWLFSGKKMLYPSLLSVLTLLAITTANITLLDIVFRDVGLLFAAIALAVIHWQDR